MSEPIVLFVDDEANILKTLQRLFLDEDYEIHTANSGKEALELIDDGLMPTVIVSDQKMPEMGGVEFLEKAKAKTPKSIRMVLTGYADINAAVDAINLGGIYRYIMKPWNDDDLKLTVKEAIERFNLLAENQRLTRELHEKNKILSQVNKHLEKKVEERTRDLLHKVKELEGRDLIQQHLVSINPIDETLQLITNVIMDVLQPAWTAIYLTDEETSRLQQKKVTPDEISINDETVRELLDSVAASKAPQGKSLSGVFSTGGDPQDAFIGALPIQSAEKLYGVLLVSSTSESGFSKEETRTLSGFCEQATIALKDAEMANNIPDLGDDLDSLLNDFAGK